MNCLSLPPPHYYHLQFFAAKAKARKSLFKSHNEVRLLPPSLPWPKTVLASAAELTNASSFSFASSQAIKNFSKKFPMNRFDPECLRDYIVHGFRGTERGVELKCHPESEAHTYLAGYETYRRGINEQLKQITW